MPEYEVRLSARVDVYATVTVTADSEEAADEAALALADQDKVEWTNANGFDVSNVGRHVYDTETELA